MSVNLIIDCGTTNLRVTAVDGSGNPLSVARGEGGVRHTAIDGHNGRLKATLKSCIESALKDAGAKASDVARCVAYGMITSNMGLLEIPHLVAPVTIRAMRMGMREQVFEDVAPFPIAFIPGVRNFAGKVDFANVSGMDMMRGEETEAVGLYDLLAPGGPCVFILPGSHNKFVSMGEQGEILGCMTSISGELLDALTHHTILADSVGHAFVDAGAYDALAAREGAFACAKSGLGRAAFTGRILDTLGGKDRATVQSYLLGAVLALDVEALTAFLPSVVDEAVTGASSMPEPVLGALGIVPAQQRPLQIFVAGKPPVQQAMCDVLDTLCIKNVSPVSAALGARMGLRGAQILGLGA